MQIEEKLEEMGLVLPPAPAKGGRYASVKRLAGDLFYISGCGPLVEGEGPVGKVGKELSLEEGQAAAERAVLNFLSAVRTHVGELDRVRSFVKVLVFVACGEDFYEQPAVADGATGLLEKLYGEQAGLPSRSAVGAPALPGNVPVEIEGIIEWR